MKNLLGLVILLTGAIMGIAFDVEVGLPETYQSVLAGENLWFTLKLTGVDISESLNATLVYEIVAPDGVIMATYNKSSVVDTQSSFLEKIHVPSKLGEGTYILRIRVHTEDGIAESNTSFDVIRKETDNQFVIKFSLFDIIISIPDKYKSVTPGNELLTSIKLINVGSQGRVDVFLDYLIFDGENNIILKRQETVAVETQANFIRTFDIPKDAKPGHSRIQARITYADGKYAASDHSFDIVSSKSYNYSVIIGGVIVAILLAIPLFKFRPDMDSFKIKSKVSSIVRRRMKILNRK